MAEIMTEIFPSLGKDEAPVSFLSIPRSDTERLAVYPFQWMRYVMSGARGDLFTTIGLRVNFLFMCEIIVILSFKPLQGLKDRITITSSELTQRGYCFRNAVIRQDGDACCESDVPHHSPL